VSKYFTRELDNIAFSCYYASSQNVDYHGFFVNFLMNIIILNISTDSETKEMLVLFIKQKGSTRKLS
jgi:hypothetical protein